MHYLSGTYAIVHKEITRINPGVDAFFAWDGSYAKGGNVAFILRQKVHRFRTQVH
jgi:hypothetical protein